MQGLASVKKFFGRTAIVPYGIAFPASPKMGQLFFRTDLKAMFIFIGVGEIGTTSGWFNLKQAVYAP
jgi:hypothetical protein